MSKSTIFFSFLSLVLGIALITTMIQLFRTNHSSGKLAAAATPLGVSADAANNDDQKIVSAQSAILMNADNNQIIYQRKPFEKMPIASITKLMAAMVALDKGIDWDRTVDISPDDDVIGGNLMLFRGESVTMRDLFNASLLGSANNATLAYVRSFGLKDEEFVELMNRKAIEIGLEQTNFVGITGLDKNNISTAYDVAKMAHYAFKNYPEIAQATRQKEYSFVIQGSNRAHTIRNTNKLISENDAQFTGSKTGFLYEAGYCLVVEGTGEKKNIMAVVLNSPSEEQHFADIRHLIGLPIPR